MSISDEIIKVIDALAEKVGIVIDWTSQNVIPYLEQLCVKYVNYEIVTSVVWMVIGIIFAVASIVILQKNKDMGVTHYLTMNDDYVGRVLLYLAGLGIPIMLIIFQIFDIVTCLTFPEKIIFEELKTLYSRM